MADDVEYLQNAFRHFASVCTGQSPLYVTLAHRIAEDPAVLALAAARSNRQPPVNMLLGAVHDLLLSGVQHDLARFYPSVGGREEPAEAYPFFVDFCRAHEAAILERVSTRRVQTNEIGRCGCLLPAITLAWARLDHRPLHLLEVGCSAGLNLHLDRYRYEYRLESAGSVHTCGPDSPARVRTVVQDGAAAPLPDDPPVVADRTGLDIAPVDVTDAEAIRWVEALIWPDQLHRIHLFRAAVALVRSDPPRLVTGDALDRLPDLIESVPAEGVPLVYHSHAIYQMDRAWRERFEAMLAERGRGRDLAHVSLEWLGDDPGPRLNLAVFRDGTMDTSHLADCHHHGAWLRWVESELAHVPAASGDEE